MKMLSNKCKLFTKITTKHITIHLSFRIHAKSSHMYSFQAKFPDSVPDQTEQPVCGAGKPEFEGRQFSSANVFEVKPESPDIYFERTIEQGSANRSSLPSQPIPRFFFVLKPANSEFMFIIYTLCLVMLDASCTEQFAKRFLNITIHFHVTTELMMELKHNWYFNSKKFFFQ